MGRPCSSKVPKSVTGQNSNRLSLRCPEVGAGGAQAALLRSQAQRMLAALESLGSAYAAAVAARAQAAAGARAGSVGSTGTPGRADAGAGAPVQAAAGAPAGDRGSTGSLRGADADAKVTPSAHIPHGQGMFGSSSVVCTA